MEPSNQSLTWRKSSRSGAGNGNENCVEVADTTNGTAVRDSKNPDGGMLRFSDTEWAAFIAGVKRGEFG